jgi:CRP/FNR family transcriptional regulator, cyclic AMP receptor protein
MSYAQLLAQVPMFEHLTSEDREHLSGLLRERSFAKDEVIFHQDDVGTALFIVRRGEVAIRLSSSEGREVTLALLARGEAFGELALLDGEPRSTDAVARKETSLLSLHQEDFRRFLIERPQVAMGLLAVLSRMVRRVTQLVYDSAFLDARARLARVLLDLARTQGQPGPEGKILIPKRTQGDLANLCGVTRESANKWLRSYAKEGLLAYKNGQITLLDPERLRRDVQKIER